MALHRTCPNSNISHAWLGNGLESQKYVQKESEWGRERRIIIFKVYVVCRFSEHHAWWLSRSPLVMPPLFHVVLDIVKRQMGGHCSSCYGTCMEWGGLLQFLNSRIHPFLKTVLWVPIMSKMVDHCTCLLLWWLMIEQIVVCGVGYYTMHFMWMRKRIRENGCSMIGKWIQ